MVNRYIALSLFLIVYNGFLLGQRQDSLRILFYNVENLFDTKDDPLTQDDDFLPGKLMNWTHWKYREKLKNITRVITAVGQMQSPAIVGLCEVENDSVLYDLTRRSPLKAQQYHYIITHSADERGMDVALLYQRDHVRLLQTAEYPIRFGNKSTRRSRNILHATFLTLSHDTLDVFVAHFPSRRGGQHQTEPARIDAASLLRSKADSLFSVRQHAHIIIMGDFNDHPDDKSLARILKAGIPTLHPSDKQLYNLFLPRIKERNFGTYKFQGRWEILDQFIISGDFLSGESTMKIRNKEATVFRMPFLLQDDEKDGGKKPFRTNSGPRYVGGFSDHLPVYMDVIINDQ
mgnify:FL=1